MSTFFKRIASSTFALLVLFVCGVDYALATIKPLRYFNHTGLTSLKQNFLVSKLPEFLASPNNPEVLLLGSSLVLVPSVRLDDQFHERKTRYDRWYYRNCIDEYTKADYFASLLSKSAGRTLSMSNLAVAASMASDQYLILKKYLAAGKKPNYIVLCLAPRDFFDNERDVVEQTPTYQVLADVTSLGDVLEGHPSLVSVSDFMAGKIWNFYRARTDYKIFLDSLASQFFGHPTTMYEAVKSAKTTKPAEATGDKTEEFKDTPAWDNTHANYTQPPNTLPDLAKYHHMYLPVNYPLFEKQVHYLDMFLQTAKNNNIPVAIVRMPLTKENWAILPPDAQTKFANALVTESQKYGATFIDPGPSSNFDKDDFEDSVHLNGKGGKKVFDFTAAKIGRIQ